MNATGPCGSVVPLQIADRAQTPSDVDEPHASRAAQRHAGAREPSARAAAPSAGSPGDGADQAEPNTTAARSPRRGRRGEMLLDRRVTDAEQHEVDRAGHVVEAVEAGPAEHLVVPRVDEVDGRARSGCG